MYDPNVCAQAMEADRVHADTIIASDNDPNGDSYTGKVPFCKCSYCSPEAWPHDIEAQLDEYVENNGPGTVRVDK